MTDEKNILLPSPIIDAKEDDSIKKLCERYEKLITPGMLAKAGKKVVEVIPKPIKNVGKKAKDAITEQELYAQCMKVAVEVQFTASSGRHSVLERPFSEANGRPFFS